MATNQFKVVSMTIPADVANAATLTVAYPAGSVSTDFTLGNAGAVADNVVIIGGSDTYVSPAVAFTYNAPSVAVVNNSGVTWRAGQSALIQLGQANSSQIGGPLGSIAQLAPAADLPTTVLKVNEIIAKTS
jgi:hypothetical protein